MLVIASATYAELLERLTRGDVDLAWLPPALCVRAIDRGMTLLLGCVRESALHPATKNYHGAMFVAQASERTVAADLRGARVAWVDPDSCSGYLFPRLVLAEEHALDPNALFAEERMLGSHDAVVRAVASGEADCGATYLDAMADGSSRAGWMRALPAEAMRVVVKSAPIPNDAICAAGSLHYMQRDAISAALADLHRAPEGAAMLRELFEVARFEPALPRHYDQVRRAMVSTGAAISSTRFRGASARRVDADRHPHVVERELGASVLGDLQVRGAAGVPVDDDARARRIDATGDARTMILERRDRHVGRIDGRDDSADATLGRAPRNGRDDRRPERKRHRHHVSATHDHDLVR
jgi:phosphonate transport system substrate-binding protein